jgi:hypothetical protein
MKRYIWILNITYAAIPFIAFGAPLDSDISKATHELEATRVQYQEFNKLMQDRPGWNMDPELRTQFYHLRDVVRFQEMRLKELQGLASMSEVERAAYYINNSELTGADRDKVMQNTAIKNSAEMLAQRQAYLNKALQAAAQEKQWVKDLQNGLYPESDMGKRFGNTNLSISQYDELIKKLEGGQQLTKAELQTTQDILKRDIELKQASLKGVKNLGTLSIEAIQSRQNNLQTLKETHQQFKIENPLVIGQSPIPQPKKGIFSRIIGKFLGTGNVGKLTTPTTPKFPTGMTGVGRTINGIGAAEFPIRAGIDIDKQARRIPSAEEAYINSVNLLHATINYRNQNHEKLEAEKESGITTVRLSEDGKRKITRQEDEANYDAKIKALEQDMINKKKAYDALIPLTPLQIRGAGLDQI